MSTENPQLKQAACYADCARHMWEAAVERRLRGEIEDEVRFLDSFEGYLEFALAEVKKAKEGK